MQKKQNIILITVDALRADHLGFMGYQKNISPHIDNLAKESIVFTQAFAVGPNTPHSFPGILTSTYPLDFQGLKKIEKPRVLISEALKKEGFVTAAFHSNPYLADFFGYNHGWNYFEYIFSPFGAGLIPSADKLTRIREKLKEFSKKLFKEVTINLYPEFFFKILYFKYKKKVSKEKSKISAEIVNQTVKEFIISQKENTAPFFMWIHYMDVHSPYFPGGKYQQNKLLSYSEFISAWLPGYLEYADKKTFKNFIKPYFKMMIDFYDEGIKYLDKELADLFNFLKKENIYQNTIICLTADHGEEFLEHGEGFHNSKLYNELLHVPLLIRIPGEKNKVIDQKVSLIDLAPTFCDLVGVKINSFFKGINLFGEKDDFIFHQTALGSNDKMNTWVEIEKISECKIACQSNQWKYIIDYTNGREELYNLLEDSMEQNNLYSSRPEILSQMREIIQEFKKTNPPLCLVVNE